MTSIRTVYPRTRIEWTRAGCARPARTVDALLMAVTNEFRRVEALRLRGTSRCRSRLSTERRFQHPRYMNLGTDRHASHIEAHPSRIMACAWMSVNPNPKSARHVLPFHQRPARTMRPAKVSPIFAFTDRPAWLAGQEQFT